MDQPKYVERNAIVIGVSGDNVDSHKKFCTRESLNFRLLADTDHKVAAAYGSLTNLGLVKFAARHSFVIDPGGTIVKVYTSVNPASHSAEVLSELDQLEKAQPARP